MSLEIPNMIALLFIAATVLTQPVRLENHFSPRVDRTDSGDTIRFELQIVNDGSQPVRLQSLRVQDTANEAPLLMLSGDGLKAAMAQTPPGCDRERATVAPHAHCVVYIDGALKADNHPGSLKNTLEFTADGQAAYVDLRLPLASTPVPVIGPPLGDGIWVAVHSPEWPRGHRRMFYKAGDREVVPGRFAIDFVKVSPSGGTSNGDPDKPADTIGYGDPVLAVVTGRIAAVRDGVAESSSIRKNGARERSLAAGNYVVLALGSGLYATYEHLRPGSIRVREGDQVRQGDIIAALGFTGDSTGPHLHFHVSNTMDPLGGEGLPYAFDRFTLMGNYPDIAQLGAKRWDQRPATEIRGKRPGVNSVLSFK
jgi:murein DD-endopeptidase